MSQCEVVEVGRQAEAEFLGFEQRSPLDEVVPQGAGEMLLKAVEEEVAAYIEAHKQERRRRRSAAGSAQWLGG